MVGDIDLVPRLWSRAFLTLLVLLAAAGPAQARPNVVLIVTDDQRADTLWAMPTVRAELGGKGVTFTQAFTVDPLSVPRGRRS